MGDVVEYGLSRIEKEHEERLYDAHTSGSVFWLKSQAEWFEAKKVEEDKVININIVSKLTDAELIEDDDEAKRLLEVAKNLNKAGLTIEEAEEVIEDDNN